MTNCSISREEAARELLIRRRARADILDFAGSIDVPGRPASEDEDAESFIPVETSMALHHRLLLRKLDEVSRRRHGRLMVFMPPGSAKSTYASVVFPSRFLGAEPDRRLILASYGDDLARKMGRRTRAVLRQPRYRGIMGAELTKESSAAQEFSLTNGSEYMSCGILSGVTGNRAHGIIIDDPVKGREAAESEIIRGKTFEAYQDDLKTRLIPGGWILLIQTRWHEDDLAGRILPVGWKGESGLITCQDGYEWEVLCLQARCEVDDDPLGRGRGQYLWPEWFDRKHWEQFESQPRTWQSLYQQRPTPLEGALFKPDNLGRLPALPNESINWVRGWDFGGSVPKRGSDPDWTVGARMGIRANGRFIISDVVRMRGLPDAVEATLVNTADGDALSTEQNIPQDPGQAGKSQVLSFTKKLAGKRVVSSPESGDKVTRAEPLAAQVNVGNVDIVVGPWNTSFIEELRGFPNGKHDDQVDAASRAFARLLEMRGPVIVPTDMLRKMNHR